MLQKIDKDPTVRLFYLISFISEPTFWFGAIFVFFTKTAGYSEAQAMSAVGFYSLVVILAEVPTGVVADKFSRKWSMIIGTFMKGLGVLSWYFVRDDYVLLMALFGFAAVGQSFLSGADNALLYDTLTDKKRQQDFRRVQGNVSLINSTMAIVFTAAGSFMAGFNPGLAMLASFPFYVLATFMMMFLPEAESSRRSRELLHSNYLVHTWDSVREILSKKGMKNGLAKVSLFTGFVVAIGVGGKWLIQLVGDVHGFNASALGTLVTLTICGRFFGTVIQKRYIHFDAWKMMDGVVLVLPFVILLMSINVLPVIMLIAFAIGILHSVANISGNQVTNDLIPTEKDRLYYLHKAFFSE